MALFQFDSVFKKQKKMAEKIINTNEWHKKYANYLYAFALSKIKDSNLAADLVQDTFLAGLHGLDHFEGKATIRTWLFSILKRKIIDYWRKQATRKTVSFSNYFTNDIGSYTYFDDRIESYSQSGNGIKEMENKELKEILYGTIYALPKKWVPIVVDRLIHEKTSEEICKKYNLTSNNMWVIMHRAKNQLKNKLSYSNLAFDS